MASSATPRGLVSLADLGRELGRAPSTIHMWVSKAKIDTCWVGTALAIRQEDAEKIREHSERAPRRGSLSQLATSAAH